MAKLLRSWFVFSSNLLPDDRRNRHFLATLFLTAWIASMLFALLFTLNKYTYDFIGLWRHHSTSDSSNFRSLSNPMVQLGLALIVAAYFIARIPAAVGEAARGKMTNKMRALLVPGVYFFFTISLAFLKVPLVLMLVLGVHAATVVYFLRTSNW